MDTQVASPPATSPDESSKDVSAASKETATKEAAVASESSRKQSFGNLISGKMFNMGQVAAAVTSKKEPPQPQQVI